MGATFSQDDRYRYSLTRVEREPLRQVDGHGRSASVLFVMLNPSTADGSVDDATIRRCRGFAERWGYPVLNVGNLFAFRATNPALMRKADDPVGPDNDTYLRAMARRADIIIAAWGAGGSYMGRSKAVTALLEDEAGYGVVYALGETKAGQPRHPLYLRNSATPKPWIHPRG